MQIINLFEAVQTKIQTFEWMRKKKKKRTCMRKSNYAKSEKLFLVCWVHIIQKLF